MDFPGKRIIGVICITAGIILFLFEFKALPHDPKDPQKWDDFHDRHFRQIRIWGRVCLLLGLTFLVT